MNQAKLYKKKGEKHYFVAVPDQHWTKGMDEMPLESLAYYPVPPYTRFTKLANWNTINSREDIIEGLREQLEYWNLKMMEQVAKEMSDADKLGGGGDIDKFERYKQRAIACSIFLKALQENPLISDTRILQEGDINTEKYISKCIK